MSIKQVISLISNSDSSVPLGNVTITDPNYGASIIEGYSVTFNVSWFGGTGPFTVTLLTDYFGSNSPQTILSNVVGNSVNISTTAKANVAWYYVRVTDSLGASVLSNQIQKPTLWIRAPSVSSYFNNTTKTAFFSASGSGNPAVSYAWYVSVNGGNYYVYTSSPNWESGQYSPTTTISAYCVTSNSAGSASSGTVYVPYS